MSKIYPTLKTLFVVSFMLVVASAAHAQTRTWVSGVGDDLNPCSRTAPCKTSGRYSAMPWQPGAHPAT